MPARCHPLIVLEGKWWNKTEAPRVLPFMKAFEENAFDMQYGTQYLKAVRVDLGYTQIRTSADFASAIRAIPAKAGAFVYVACHGDGGKDDSKGRRLIPGDGRTPIAAGAIARAITENAKRDAIAFLHFGACEFVDGGNPKSSLESLSASGKDPLGVRLSKTIEWMKSTLFDLALIENAFVPYCRAKRPRIGRLARRTFWRTTINCTNLHFQGTRPR